MVCVHITGKLNEVGFLINSPSSRFKSEKRKCGQKTKDGCRHQKGARAWVDAQEASTPLGFNPLPIEVHSLPAGGNSQRASRLMFVFDLERRRRLALGDISTKSRNR